MAKLFKNKTTAQHESSLAHFLPPGIAFVAANTPDTNFSKLITGLAGELIRAYDSINDISEDYDILVTDELLTNWESAVGIPDHCFPGTGSNATRRLHVLLKFAKMNVQTAPQMVELAVALGFADTTIQALGDSALPPYNVPFTPSAAPGSRYIIVVYATNAVTNNPPYDVPFTPAADNTSLLKCIMDIIKPANTQVIFGNYLPKDFSPLDLDNCDVWLDAADYDTVTLTGANLLNGWADKAQDNDASAASIQPTWIPSMQNGYGIVRFNNAQSMTISGSTIFDLLNGDYTIFIVSKQNVGVVTDYLLSFSYGVLQNGFVRYQNSSVAVGDYPVEYSGAPSANFEIVRARREGVTQAITINGATETTNLLGSNPTDPTDTVNIGSLAGLFDFLTADIAEIIIYSRSLLEEESYKVETYLTDKWAL